MSGRTRIPILSAKDRWLKLQALALLVAVRLALALLPFRIVLRLQRRFRRMPAPDAAPDDASVRRTARAVERVSRFVPGARCLAQALAGQILFARRNIATELRVGVTRGKGGGIEAHAWLVRDGATLVGEGQNERFTTLSRARGAPL